MNSWQIVRQKPQRKIRQARIYVSLNKRGEIAMNALAWKALKEPYNVTLLYDEQARCVGVKCPVAADRHFFPARPYGRGRQMRIVRAARLLKQFGIEVAETLVFLNVEVRAIGQEPMLVLELDGAPSIAR